MPTVWAGHPAPLGVARLLEPQRSSAFSKLQRSLKLTRPYFLVQATDGLDAFARLMTNHRKRYSGYQIVVIPIGPALGDDVARLREAFPDLVTLPDYPHPLLTAELIGRAAAVVGVSLHLSITAVALGTPMFRPATEFSAKYAVLASRINVHASSPDREISPEWFEAKLAERGPEDDAAQIVQTLDRHWDAVAARFTSARKSNNHEVGLVWQQLPRLLEDAAAAAEVETKAAIADRDERIGALTGGIADREDTISGLTQTVAERDARIAQFETSLADHERQAGAARNSLEGARAALEARGAEVRAASDDADYRCPAEITQLKAGRSQEHCKHGCPEPFASRDTGHRNGKQGEEDRWNEDQDLKP